MFDFVKLAYKETGLTNRLLQCCYLRFDEIRETFAPFTLKRYKAKYKNLEFTLYPNDCVLINGSIHKYHNNGSHNHDDFTIENVGIVIKDLQMKFGIIPKKTSVHNLEFGCNIKLSYCPDILLDKLLAFKNKQFSDMEIRARGKGKVASFYQYVLKIYNKTIQYNLTDNVLRFEKKVTSMVAISKSPVYLSDLIDIEFCELCRDQLFDMLNSIIIAESFDSKTLTELHKRKLASALNPKQWENINSKQRLKFKTFYHTLCNHYSKTFFYKDLMHAVKDKTNELISIV
jgi:hypothetical protein